MRFDVKDSPSLLDVDFRNGQLIVDSPLTIKQFTSRIGTSLKVNDDLTVVSYMGRRDVENQRAAAAVEIADGKNLLLFTSSNSFVAGDISGEGGLVFEPQKENVELKLSGENSYTGTTEIKGGKFNLNSSLVGPVEISKDAKFKITGDKKSVIEGAISGEGGIVLNKDGLLTPLVLRSNDNSYTGPTQVLKGKLIVDGLLGDETDVFVAKGAHMEFDETDRIASLTGEGQVQLQTADLIIGSDQDTEWGGVLFGNGGLVKDGSGVLTLTGPNTYVGNTAILDGSIVLGRKTTLPYDSEVEIKGGNFDLNGHENVNLGAVTLNGGTLKNSSGNAWLIPDVYVSAGNESQKFSSIDVSEEATLELSGVIDGDSSAALKKIGKGELILSGKNAYSGATMVTGGTLRLAVDQAIPQVCSVTIKDGGVLDLDGNTNTFNAKKLLVLVEVTL